MFIGWRKTSADTQMLQHQIHGRKLAHHRHWGCGKRIADYDLFKMEMNPTNRLVDSMPIRYIGLLSHTASISHYFFGAHWATVVPPLMKMNTDSFCFILIFFCLNAFGNTINIELITKRDYGL